METNPPEKIAPNKLSIAARIGWVVLIAATLYVCYFSHLGAIGFVGPDEPRYAWIARDMAETGDWVTPRLYGKPWFEKPPLFYWGAAICFKVFGVSEAAARLPSAICALLATLAMAWLAWRMYGAETARWLLLLLPTTVGMIGFSHAAATDMPFGGMLTIAMVCAAVLLRLVPALPGEASPAAAGGDSEASGPELGPRPVSKTPWLALVLFGAFLGLAVLAKGPAGIVLCGGAVFFWALFTKRWRDAFRLLHPAAIATFCITTLPWYTLCARRNPDFFRVFIIEHNFRRYLTPEFQHIQPVWFYLPVVTIALFPWIPLLLPLTTEARDLWKNGNLKRSPMLWLLCWAAFTLLFFSASKSKLPGYILPAVPPSVLLLAEACRRLPGKTVILQRWTGILFALALFAMVVGVFLVGSWNMSKLEPNADVTNHSLTDRLPLPIFLLGVILTPVLAITRGAQRALFFGALIILAGLLTSYSSPSLSLEDLSARRLAGPMADGWQTYAGQRLGYFGLRRSYLYTLNFYFHEELPLWEPGDDRPQWVFTDFNNAQQANAVGLRCEMPRFIVIKTPIVVCANPESMTSPAGSGQPK